MLTLCVIWWVKYHGGVAWTENPNLEFNWHPILMTLGLVFIYGQGKEILLAGQFQLMYLWVCVPDSKGTEKCNFFHWVSFYKPRDLTGVHATLYNLSRYSVCLSVCWSLSPWYLFSHFSSKNPCFFVITNPGDFWLFFLSVIVFLF